MNKRVFFYIKTKLFQVSIHPFFYIVAILFNIACMFQFFVSQHFFTGAGTSDLHYFFYGIPTICVIIIPLLCVKTEGYVYDDYLPLSDYERCYASLIVSFIKYFFIIIPLIFIPVCVNWFGSVDVGQCAAGFLGIILYGSAACALCLFWGEVFNQRKLAFVCAASFLTLINYADNISMYFKEISFSWHFNAAEKGIVDSRDCIFYLIVTAFFLIGAVYVAQKKRGKVFLHKQKVTFFLIIVIGVLFLFDSSRYYFRSDWTKEKKFSISLYSKKLLSKAKEPLRITYYCSKELSVQYPQVRDVSDFLNQYCSVNKRIIFEIKDPESQDMQLSLSQYGIQGQQLKIAGKNKTEYEIVYSTIVLEYLGKTAIIPFILSSDTLEYELDARAELLISSRNRSVLILCGNGFSMDTDYSYVIPWFTTQGITSKVIDNLSEKFEQTLLSYNEPLIVFGSSQLNEKQTSVIEQFVMNGGKVFFAVSPYSIDIKGNWSVSRTESPLVNLLTSWGFSFPHELAADVSCSTITLSSDEDKNGYPLSQTQTKKINYPFWIDIMSQKNAKQGLTLFWPVPIQANNETVQSILFSSPLCTAVPESNESPMFDTNPFTAFKILDKSEKKRTYVFAAEKIGKVKGLYTSSESRNTHIIVVSDQYFVDSLMMEYNGGEYGDYRNLDFLTNIVLRLNGEEELALLQNRTLYATSLYKIVDADEFNFIKLRTYFILCVIVPMSYIFAAIYAIVIRKKWNKEFLVKNGDKIKK